MMIKGLVGVSVVALALGGYVAHESSLFSRTPQANHLLSQDNGYESYHVSKEVWRDLNATTKETLCSMPEEYRDAYVQTPRETKNALFYNLQTDPTKLAFFTAEKPIWQVACKFRILPQIPPHETALRDMIKRSKNTEAGQREALWQLLKAECTAISKQPMSEACQ